MVTFRAGSCGPTASLAILLLYSFRPLFTSGAVRFFRLLFHQ
jgi:hypothetical protein